MRDGLKMVAQNIDMLAPDKRSTGNDLRGGLHDELTEASLTDSPLDLFQAAQGSVDSGLLVHRLAAALLVLRRLRAPRLRRSSIQFASGFALGSAWRFGTERQGRADRRSVFGHKKTRGLSPS